MKYMGFIALAAFAFSLNASPARAEDSGLKHIPTDAEGLYDYGYTFFKYEEYAKASEVFGMFMKKYPNNRLSASALFHLGRSKEKTGDFKEAWDAYNEVIQRFKKERFWVAVAKSQKGELEESVLKETE